MHPSLFFSAKAQGNCMKLLNNQNGVALVTALMLTLISLAMVLTLLYFITQGINVSGASKRYRNALAASHGGVDVFAKDIIPKVFSGISSSKIATDYNVISLAFPNNACFQQKLRNLPADWSSCSSANSSFDPKTAPDVTFQLKGEALSSDFRVYAKIVDTKPGNSDPSNIDYLDGGAGVIGTSPGVNPKHLPARFRIEVQGEKSLNPKERAQLSVYYAY